MSRSHDVISELNGTCKSLYDVLTDFELDDKDLLDDIDNELFECSVCGWWCEHSEDTGEFVCEDCAD